MTYWRDYWSQISWKKTSLGLDSERREDRYCPFLLKPSMLKDIIDSHNVLDLEEAADSVVEDDGGRFSEAEGEDVGM